MRLPAALLLALVAAGCPPANVEGPKADDSAADTADTAPDTAPDDPDADGFVGADDCDEGDASVHVGALETCDGDDEDCDGVIDDGATDAATWYGDGDGDGHGAGDPVESCGGEGYAASDDDCDDTRADVHPGAEDDCSDPVDHDCDGVISYVDDDGDGWAACVDCDDAASDTHPAAVEVCDGRDDDCDEVIDEDATATWYRDGDGDGDGTPDDSLVTGCAGATGYVANALDCDDANPDVFGSNSEFCNGVDDDCDGLVDSEDGAEGLVDGPYLWTLDADGDGFGNYGDWYATCEDVAPAGYGVEFSDCDDGDAAVNPGSAEVCDSVDNDCDGDVDDADSDVEGSVHYYEDLDGDGYGDGSFGWAACDTSFCRASGYWVCATTGGDCDDGNPATSPGAPEVVNSIDDDCDGLVDE